MAAAKRVTTPADGMVQLDDGLLHVRAQTTTAHTDCMPHCTDTPCSAQNIAVRLEWQDRASLALCCKKWKQVIDGLVRIINMPSMQLALPGAACRLRSLR